MSSHPTTSATTAMRRRVTNRADAAAASPAAAATDAVFRREERRDDPSCRRRRRGEDATVAIATTAATAANKSTTAASRCWAEHRKRLHRLLGGDVVVAVVVESFAIPREYVGGVVCVLPIHKRRTRLYYSPFPYYPLIDSPFPPLLSPLLLLPLFRSETRAPQSRPSPSYGVPSRSSPRPRGFRTTVGPEDAPSRRRPCCTWSCWR